MGFTGPKPALKVAIGVVVGSAAVAFALVVREGGLGDSHVTLTLMAGAVLAGLFPVRAPDRRVDLAPTHPFVLCALIVSGPLAAIAVDLVGVLSAAIGRRHTPRPEHFLYNLASAVLATCCAAGALTLAGGTGTRSIEALAVPFGAAAIVYFAANVLLISLAVSLEKGRPLLETIATACVWTGLSYFAGVSAAVAMVAVSASPFPWMLAVGLPPAWTMTVLHRVQLKHAAANR